MFSLPLRHKTPASARQGKVAAVGLAAMTLAACQTTPVQHTGFLSSYEGVTEQRSLRAAIHHRRDDAASDAVNQVYIEPAILLDNAAGDLDQGERSVVLREIDRQTCFRISRRFTVAQAPGPDTAIIRTAVVQINPTGRVGSAISAVGGAFVPIPLLDFRAPTTTGGLAIESEMIAPNGEQIASLTWARNANVVGRDSPSLSRVGDALSMAGPAGKAISTAYASKTRDRRDVEDPDPCGQFGARRNAPRWVADKVFGALTGLYAPEISGTPPAQASVSDPVAVVP